MLEFSNPRRLDNPPHPPWTSCLCSSDVPLPRQPFRPPGESAIITRMVGETSKNEPLLVTETFLPDNLISSALYVLHDGDQTRQLAAFVDSARVVAASLDLTGCIYSLVTRRADGDFVGTVTDGTLATEVYRGLAPALVAILPTVAASSGRFPAGITALPKSHLHALVVRGDACGRVHSLPVAPAKTTHIELTGGKVKVHDVSAIPPSVYAYYSVRRGVLHTVSAGPALAAPPDLPSLPRPPAPAPRASTAYLWTAHSFADARPRDPTLVFTVQVANTPLCNVIGQLAVPATPPLSAGAGVTAFTVLDAAPSAPGPCFVLISETRTPSSTCCVLHSPTHSICLVDTYPTSVAAAAGAAVTPDGNVLPSAACNHAELASGADLCGVEAHLALAATAPVAWLATEGVVAVRQPFVDQHMVTTCHLRLYTCTHYYPLRYMCSWTPAPESQLGRILTLPASVAPVATSAHPAAARARALAALPPGLFLPPQPPLASLPAGSLTSTVIDTYRGIFALTKFSFLAFSPLFSSPFSSPCSFIPTPALLPTSLLRSRAGVLALAATYSPRSMRTLLRTAFQSETIEAEEIATCIQTLALSGVITLAQQLCDQHPPPLLHTGAGQGAPLPASSTTPVMMSIAQNGAIVATAGADPRWICTERVESEPVLLPLPLRSHDNVQSMRTEAVRRLAASLNSIPRAPVVASSSLVLRLGGRRAAPAGHAGHAEGALRARLRSQLTLALVHQDDVTRGLQQASQQCLLILDSATQTVARAASRSVSSAHVLAAVGTALAAVGRAAVPDALVSALAAELTGQEYECLYGAGVGGSVVRLAQLQSPHASPRLCNDLLPQLPADRARTQLDASMRGRASEAFGRPLEEVVRDSVALSELNMQLESCYPKN